MYRGMYLKPRWGPWRPELEEEFRRRWAQVQVWQETEPGSAERAALIERYGQERLEKAKQRYQYLRTARLMAWLRGRAPDDLIHYTMLVYHLDQANLDRALWGPAPLEAEDDFLSGRRRR